MPVLRVLTYFGMKETGKISSVAVENHIVVITIA